MLVLSFIADGFALALGSVLAAALFCWLSWTAFKVIRHPEWGPPLLLGAVVLWFGPATITSSAFLRPALMFAILAAALAWPQGKDWRTLRRERGPMTPRLALAHLPHLPVWHRRKSAPTAVAVPAIMDRPAQD